MFDIKPIFGQDSNKKATIRKNKKTTIRKKDSLVKSRLKNKILILHWYHKQEIRKRILVLMTLFLLIVVIFLLFFKGFFVKNYCASKGLTTEFGSINKKNSNPFENLVYAGSDSGVCGEAIKEIWTEKPKYDLCKKGCPSSVAIDQNGKAFSWACLYQDVNNNSLNSYCQSDKSQDGITNFYYQQQDKINVNQTGQSCSVYDKKGSIVNNLDNIYYITKNSNTPTNTNKNTIIDKTNTKIIESNIITQSAIQVNSSQSNQQIDEIDQTINNSAAATPVPIIQINGSCGNSHQKILQSKPITNLCTSGVPSKVTNLSAWFWICYGLNDGENDHCYSQKMIETIIPENKVDGVCSSSHGQTLNKAPTQDLCVSGTPSNVIGDGPWYWDCLPSGGGQVQKCQAQVSTTNSENVVGACGSAHANGFYSIPTESDDLCSTGVPGKINGSGPWNWSCYGTDFLNSDLACEAYVRIDGVCGADDNTSSKNPPINLCSVGASTLINTEQTEWSWNCEGEYGGLNPLCKRIRIVDGVCGSSHNATIEPDASDPNSNLCSVGDNSSVSKTIKSLGVSRESPVWQWTCSNINNGNIPNCYACSWNYEAIVNNTFYMTGCRRAKICPDSNGIYNTLPDICPCCVHGGFGANPACVDAGC
jgi:type II secretory pathway component PulM